MEGQRISNGLSRWCYCVTVLVLCGASSVSLAQFRNASDSLRKPNNWDERLFWSINHPSDESQFRDRLFYDISASVAPLAIGFPIGIVAAGVAGKNTSEQYAGISMAASVAATIILQEVLIKPLVKRDRPYKQLDSVRLIDSAAKGYSFPSSHAATSFGLATGLSLWYPKWYVIGPSFLFALAACYSRPYLGVHFPTDVLAGAVIGSVVELLTYSIFHPKINNSPPIHFGASHGVNPVRIGLGIPISF